MPSLFFPWRFCSSLWVGSCKVWNFAAGSLPHFFRRQQYGGQNGRCRLIGFRRIAQERLEGYFKGSLHQVDPKGRTPDVKGRIEWIFHGDGKGPGRLPKVFLSVLGSFWKEEAVKPHGSTHQYEIKVRRIKFQKFHQQASQALGGRPSFVIGIPFAVLQKRENHHLQQKAPHASRVGLVQTPRGHEFLQKKGERPQGRKCLHVLVHQCGRLGPLGLVETDIDRNVGGSVREFHQGYPCFFNHLQIGQIV
mmetsp:Transcript_18292/g.37731  ORF Transcript_18292/g.37731 Transcript_18292/m.37731 type:complete len:249 (+) Transcript_18292:2259-3005(+)